MKEKTQLLDISWGTILKFAFSLFCFYLVYEVRDILVWSIFGLIISVLLNPAIDFLQRRLSRSLAVIFIYVTIFSSLGLIVYWLFPLLFSEIKQFSQLFPQYFERIAPPLQGLGIEAFESMESFIGALGEFVQRASSDILGALSIIFGGVGATFFIGFVAFFISLEEKGIERLIVIFTPRKYNHDILNLWKRCQNKVSGWFGARIATGALVAILVFIALQVFNVKYAFTLSFLAGIFEIIPILGPVIAGVIAFILVGIESWLKAFFVLGAFILIQQIEGNILTPILTKKFIGLPPALVLISLAIGGKLLGFLGAILAIPIAGILFEFFKSFLEKRKGEQTII